MKGFKFEGIFDFEPRSIEDIEDEAPRKLEEQQVGFEDVMSPPGTLVPSFGLYNMASYIPFGAVFMINANTNNTVVGYIPEV